jgi:hypothetical protein
MFESKQQILAPGGLNLLTDIIDGRDSIGMKNFRTDGSGVLRTRMSNSYISTNIGKLVNMIFRSKNTRFYGTYAGDLYAGGSSIATGYDGDPLFLVAQNGVVFVMNRAYQRQVIDPEGTPVSLVWLPDPPAAPGWSVTGTAGGFLVDNVTYSYYVTFVQSDGTESNPSAVKTLVPSAGNNTAHISITNASTSALTVGANIYRVGNTLEDVYRVNHTPLSFTLGAATYDDDGWGTNSDLEVTRFGIPMEDDHDAVPAARVLAGPYYGRMLAASSAAHPNRIWWTPVNKPFYWPQDNYVDLGESSDEIFNITLHTGQARIYMKRAVWRLRGDPDSGVAERTNADVGLIGSKAIASAGPRDYFQGMEGIYANDGDTVKKFSTKLDPLFRETLPMPAGRDLDLQVLDGTEAKRMLNCLAVKNGRLFFSYVAKVSALGVPNQMVVCNLESGDWSAENAPSASQPAAYTALTYEGQASELLGAAPDGKIYALEYPLPETTVIAHRWVSGWTQPGPRERVSRFADLVVEHGCKTSASANRSLTVKLLQNYGDVTPFAAGSIPVAETASGGTTRRVSVFPLGSDGSGIHARSAAVLIEGDSEQEVSLYSATLHYRVEPRDALTWTSGAVSLGDPRVKTIDLIDLVIWNRGTVTWELWTDLPGNVMTMRTTGTFAAVTDRTPITLAIDPGFDGRLVELRLKSTGTNIFWLYSAQLRYTAINYYLSDSNKSLDFPARALAIAA